MEKYGTLIWILVAIITIALVIKLVKKAIGVIIVIGLLIFCGLLPYSTVKNTINTVTGGYETIKKQAALWTIEENTEGNGEKILYILNSIPITLKKGDDLNDEEILNDLAGGEEKINEVNKYLDNTQQQIKDKTGINLDEVSGQVTDSLKDILYGK